MRPRQQSHEREMITPRSKMAAVYYGVDLCGNPRIVEPPYDAGVAVDGGDADIRRMRLEPTNHARLDGVDIKKAARPTAAPLCLIDVREDLAPAAVLPGRLRPCEAC